MARALYIHWPFCLAKCPYCDFNSHVRRGDVDEDRFDRLARALGGEVSRSPHPEIGWYEVHSDNPALVPHGPWFQWHFDRFTPPPGAVELARNLGTTQAFVQGRALGLQFHPEVDEALVSYWIDSDEQTSGEGGMAALGVDADELRTRTTAVADDAARRLRLLVRGFLGLLDQNLQHDVDGTG